jgi:glutathione S-transferase
MPEREAENFKLYSAAFSFYSMRARSYLVKQHVDFDEISPSSQDYLETVLPQTERFIIPVMKTPEGEIVQDGIAIMEWFENRGLARVPAYALGPRQGLATRILEFYFGEHLIKPAMHYRWNFEDINRAYLRLNFSQFSLTPQGPPMTDEDLDKAMGRMRKATRLFGVTDDTKQIVEAGYQHLQSVLEDHFAKYPYLFGGCPSAADYSLYALIGGHMIRDPYPSSFVRREAPLTVRWSERMSQPHADIPEFPSMAMTVLTDDEVPEGIHQLLQLVAEDFLEEIRAHVEFANNWLGQNPDIKTGEVVGGAARNRVLGECHFTWKGVPVDINIQPYRLYMLHRVQSYANSLDEADRIECLDLLRSTGLEGLLALQMHRPVERRNNREIWGEEAAPNPNFSA